MFCRRPVSSISLTARYPAFEAPPPPAARAPSPEQALVYVGELRDAGKRQFARELGLHDLERLGDSNLAVRAEAIEMRAARGARARAERERLQDVCSSAHAAVQDHLEA